MSVNGQDTLRSSLKSQYWAVVNSRKFYEFTRSTTNLLGLGIVFFLISGAVFAPIVAPYDPTKQHIEDRLEPPSGDHLMGTDRLGRDLFTRILYGARISLQISFAVVAITLLIGGMVGVISGYAGGLIDEALMRFVDMLIAFPGLLFALVIAAVLGPSLLNIMIALSVVGWTGYARIIRGTVLSVKEDKFVKAAQIMGASRTRIIMRHLVPNVISPIVVLATMNMATVVLLTSGLSFLGFGAQPPTPEWGNMLANSRPTIITAWWVSTFPGLAIMVTVLGFNLLGDGLRDVLDPRDITGKGGAGL